MVELNGRNGLFGLIKGMMQSSKGQVPKLQGNPWKAIEGIDKIYIMTPIWGSNMTPVMASFLQKADFKGKEAVAITLQADRKGNGSGSFIDGYALHGAFPGKFAGKDYIESQINKKF